MNYDENFVTRKTKSIVTGTDYRIDYIVKNEPGKKVDSITATVVQVGTEGEGEQKREKLIRIGNACVDSSSNRTYFAIEKHAEVKVENQAKIAAQFYADAKTILAEPIV